MYRQVKARVWGKLWMYWASFAHSRPDVVLKSTLKSIFLLTADFTPGERSGVKSTPISRSESWGKLEGKIPGVKFPILHRHKTDKVGNRHFTPRISRMIRTGLTRRNRDEWCSLPPTHTHTHTHTRPVATCIFPFVSTRGFLLSHKGVGARSYDPAHGHERA